MVRLSYKESCKILGTERANQLFESHGIEKTLPGRKPKPKREMTEKEYIKLKEDDHGKMFANFLREEYPEIKFTHIGNEAGQGGTKNIIIMMAKKKSLGVSPGFPDYIIKIPNDNGFNITLHIELKKAKGPKGGWNGSSFKEEQAKWLNHLQEDFCSYVELAHGFKEAKKYFLDYYLKYKSMSIEDIIEDWKTRHKKDYLQLITTTK